MIIWQEINATINKLILASPLISLRRLHKPSLLLFPRSICSIVHMVYTPLSKVLDFGTNQKRVWNFLSVLSSNIGPILQRFRDIRAFVCRMPHFSHPTLCRRKFRGDHFRVCRSVMLQSAESEHPRLTNCEIIFEDFQHMWSRYLNLTDRRTDWQTGDLP